MKNLSSFIINKRWIVIILVLIITISLSFFSLRLKVNPDVMSYLPEDDAVSKLFDEVGEQFGGNQTAIIGIKTDEIFTYPNLCLIRDITDSLKNMPGIKSVVSLTNIIDIREQDSTLTVAQLVDTYEIPQNQKQLDSIKNYTLSKDLYKGFIVSADSKMTMIALKINEGFTEAIDTPLTGNALINYYKQKYPDPMYSFIPMGDTMKVEIDKMLVSENIRKKLSKWYPKTELLFGGLPFMMKDIGSIILHDIVFLGPIALLVILIALYLGFRNFRGVLLPIITVIVAIAWTLSIMGLLGFEITMVSNVTPIILLAVGSAYAIHVINRIEIEELNEKGNFKDKISIAIKYITIPVLLAAVTTIIGFLSFIFGSYLTMIQEFGIFTALGVFFSLILSLTFAPALISFFPSNKKHSESDYQKGIITPFLMFLHKLSTKYKKVIFAIWIIVIGVSIWGSLSIERSVDLLDYFKKDHPSRIDESTLRQSFGGTIPIYIQVNGNMQSPEALLMMKDIQKYLEQQPMICHVQSVAILIEEMNNIMGEGKTIPESEEKISNLWFLLDGQEIMEQLVTPDYQSGLVQAVVTSSDSKIMAQLVDSVQNYINHLPNNPNIKVQQTGFPSIYKQLDESIISSQKQSMIIAIILVLVFVSILLKSGSKGFITTVPILATLVVLFGFLGWSGIPLDVATVLVASVSIGIGIDYAIHMISHFSHEIKKNGNINESMLQTFKESGKAIVLNVFSVTAGFLVLLFSDLVPLQRFGIAVAVTMITSGLATLTLMPILIVFVEKIKNKIKK